MTTSLSVSVKPEEFVGFENEVGEGLAQVGSARAYITGPQLASRQNPEARFDFLISDF
jgi:hypothetical protein